MYAAELSDSTTFSIQFVVCVQRTACTCLASDCFVCQALSLLRCLFFLHMHNNSIEIASFVVFFLAQLCATAWERIFFIAKQQIKLHYHCNAKKFCLRILVTGLVYKLSKHIAANLLSFKQAYQVKSGNKSHFYFYPFIIYKYQFKIRSIFCSGFFRTNQMEIFSVVSAPGSSLLFYSNRSGIWWHYRMVLWLPWAIIKMSNY